jgi:hypothetical protein
VSAWAAGVLSIAGVVVGILIQWKLSEKQRERDRAESRTQRVAGVLGRMRPLLDDLRPDGIVSTSAFIVRSFYKDPWTPLRAELSVLIASEPAGDLRGRLLELDGSMDKLFESLLVMVDTQLQLQMIEAGQPVRNRYEDAKERYAETQRLWRGIIDDLHGSVEGRGRKSSPTA